MKHARTMNARRRVIAVLAFVGVLAVGVRRGPTSPLRVAGPARARSAVAGARLPTSAGVAHRKDRGGIWTGVTDPGPGTFGYYVTRTPYSVGSHGELLRLLSTSLLPATPTSCSDTSVPNGTYTYMVTAVYNSFTATSSPSGTGDRGPCPHRQRPWGQCAPSITAPTPYWVNGVNVTLTDTPTPTAARRSPGHLLLLPGVSSALHAATGLPDRIDVERWDLVPSTGRVVAISPQTAPTTWWPPRRTATPADQPGVVGHRGRASTPRRR